MAAPFTTTTTTALQRTALFLLLTTQIISCNVSAFHSPPPEISPATGLKNQMYEWRGQQIRYQVSEPSKQSKSGRKSNGQSVVLVHGLFVNADHWRKTLKDLGEEGYTVYALDLLGSGYSSKPPRDSIEAQMLNGENFRFFETDDEMLTKGDTIGNTVTNDNNKRKMNSVVPQVNLGTAFGGRRISDVDLRHPLNSCYNFYTWAEQISDFTTQIVQPQQNDNDNNNDNNNDNKQKKVTLVCNSIGTISSLQATIDTPDLFNGIFVVAPNFRELHVAEVAFPSLSMPIVRTIQKNLREKGQGLFEALAKPKTVQQILMEPYAIQSQVDDELVNVLLTPLLTKGASDVVFDTLSYSAGPLPEQQLADPNFPKDCPVWICYGTKDPWTPAKRVEELATFEGFGGKIVEKVVALPGVGHCPHDEAPEMVNPLLVQFLERLRLEEGNNENSATSTKEPNLFFATVKNE